VKENEQLFIYYLFGQPIIYKINYLQSKKINNILNWEHTEYLKKIFESNNYLLDNKKGEVNLLITYKENNNKKIKRFDDFCLWKILY
jgi:hypothetical protein